MTQCDECKQPYERRADDPMDKLCRPCSAKLYGYHPKTGHEHAIPEPENWRLPKGGFTIHVSQDLLCEVSKWESGQNRTCDKGTKGCIFDHTVDDDGSTWYAQIHGKDENGEEFSQMTYGRTEVEATFMAFDLMAMLFDECHPWEKGDGELYPHCFCRDTTYSSRYRAPGEPEVHIYKQCCRCQAMHPASDFKR